MLFENKSSMYIKAIRKSYQEKKPSIRNIFISDLVLLREIFDVNYDEFFKGLNVSKPETKNHNQ